MRLQSIALSCLLLPAYALPRPGNCCCCGAREPIGLPVGVGGGGDMNLFLKVWYRSVAPQKVMKKREALPAGPTVDLPISASKVDGAVAGSTIDTAATAPTVNTATTGSTVNKPSTVHRLTEVAPLSAADRAEIDATIGRPPDGLQKFGVGGPDDPNFFWSLWTPRDQ